MKNYFYDTNLVITKSNIAKDGELKDLEINHQNIELGGEVVSKLYAWKYSSSYIYTQSIPTTAGSVAIIKQSPMVDATGTYSAGSEAQTHDIWKIGANFYNSDLSSGTAPAGSAGTPVDLGDVVIASDDKWYMKDTNWYEVVELEDDQAVLSTTAVSDEDLLAELEAATPAELDYVPYTEAAVPAGITVSGNIYERYTTGDYTVQ